MKNKPIDYSFSERHGKNLCVVINGCAGCPFRVQNKEYKYVCHFTDKLLTQDKEWSISCERGCKLPVSFENGCLSK